MDISQDVRTISTQMVANFKDDSAFYLTDIIICNLIVDIHFRYISSSDTETIIIEVYNDNVRDADGVGVILLHFNISQQMKKRSITEFCELAIENILDYLKTVKFDTLLGRFIPTTYAGYLQTSALKIATKNIFKSIGIPVVDNSGDCCVCYEKTYCKTTCGHHLCFECCSNLKPAPPSPEEDTDDYQDNVLCPTCRGICLYSHTGGCNNGNH